jgi:hypothetical protein
LRTLRLCSDLWLSWVRDLKSAAQFGGRVLQNAFRLQFSDSPRLLKNILLLELKISGLKTVLTGASPLPWGSLLEWPHGIVFPFVESER